LKPKKGIGDEAEHVLLSMGSCGDGKLRLAEELLNAWTELWGLAISAHNARVPDQLPSGKIERFQELHTYILETLPRFSSEFKRSSLQYGQSQPIVSVLAAYARLYDFYGLRMDLFRQFEDAWKHGNVQLKTIVGELRKPKEEAAIARERDAEITSELKQSLRSIDPKFEALYDGACEALRSKNKERLRHAVVSMRELLKLVIDRLGVGENRKQKVMSILCNERAAELVEHVLDLQSKEMKEVEPNYDDTVFAIKTGEYTLHYLLTRRPKKHGEDDG
jgi:signal transduction histidine kinase